jgi:hypothetical protein
VLPLAVAAASAWCAGLGAVGAIVPLFAAGEEALVLLVYVVVASLGVLTPLVVSLVLGERSRAILVGLRG